MAFSNSLTATNTFIKHIFKTYTACVLNIVRDFSHYFARKYQIKESNVRENCREDLDALSPQPCDENRAGLPHLEAISQVIKKPIEVYDEDEKFKFAIGNEKYNQTPIKVQYHKNAQHYTLLRNKEPFACGKGGMCLYNCISDCTNTDPNLLKVSALDVLRRGLVQLQLYAGRDQCWGGASYTGSGPVDAASYLDNCQGKQGHKFPARAHPRSHASNPSGVGVEAYSFEGRKTGFESYQDQDFVAHYALQNRKTAASLDALNRGALREVVHISRQELALPRPMQGGTWIQGSRTNTFDVSTVTLVIQHYQGEYNNSEAPVFIQTMYPRYP